jgi:hypothetical protein
MAWPVRCSRICSISWIQLTSRLSTRQRTSLAWALLALRASRPSSPWRRRHLTCPLRPASAAGSSWTLLLARNATPALAHLRLGVPQPAKAASTSSGPETRTLTIPPTGCVPVGRASGSEIKNRRPSADNALFNCSVMSRIHASISAPQA